MDKLFKNLEKLRIILYINDLKDNEEISMSGRLIFIAMISFLGISFFVIILGMYLYMKRTVSKGKSLLDEAVNTQENTSK